jgi:polysaccharide export outer membrane protein
MKLFKYIVLGIIFVLSINSCSLQRNKLFKIPKGSDFSFDTLPAAPYPDYKIAIDDKITFSVLANNGEKLFLGNSQNSLGTGDFTVRKDGKTYIPLLGDLTLIGLTVKECEELLTKEFSKYINDPYIKLTISNSRVIVFKGNGSKAAIVQLNNAKTTLLEIIAQSGGIPERGSADNIRIVRTVNNKRKVFIIDLSTIDKLELGEMLVQANDYIFIEERVNIPLEITKEYTPYLSLITTAITTYTFFKIFSK